MSIIKETLVIERYKYILARKSQLNDATFKVITLYQVVIFALALSFYNIYLSYHEHRLPVDSAFFFCSALIVLYAMFTFLIAALLIGGICAWFKYRKDENEIQFEFFNMERPGVSFKNIFSWYEFYIIIFVIGLCIASVGAYISRLNDLFPNI